MNISEIMAHVVRNVAPADPVQKAARLMRDYDIGCVPVCEQGRLLGLLTDRDLAIRVLAQGELAGSVATAEVMTRDPVCCRIDDTVKQAAAIMERHHIRRLPVLDHQGRLAGIVSLGDISTHAPHELSGELIEQVSQREHSRLAETA